MRMIALGTQKENFQTRVGTSRDLATPGHARLVERSRGGARASPASGAMQGQLDAAEGLLRRQLDGSDTALGPTHPESRKCATFLAEILATLGRLDAAKADEAQRMRDVRGLVVGQSAAPAL